MKDWLDSASGHIATCLFLICLGISIEAYNGLKIPSAHDVVVFALGALGRSMLGQNGKGKQPEPPKPDPAV